MTLQDAHSIAPLFGLVLTGGKSTRMGQPKAELDYHGTPQWKFCYELLGKYCDKVFVSTSCNWSAVEPGYQTIADMFVESFGPLSGILSAMMAYKEAAWLVLACDLPYFTDDAISMLVKSRNPVKPVTAFMHADNSFPEPLCAIYEPSARGHLLSHWGEGRNCPTSIVKRLDFEKLHAPYEQWLMNVNSPGGRGTWEVKIVYYAALREQRGCDKEAISTSCTTLRALYENIAAIHALKLPIEHVRVAQNGRFVDWSNPIMAGDEIVFIPPVAGG